MFGTPKCGHCGHQGTKIAAIEPAGAAYKQIAIMCSSCNAVLSTTNYFDVGSIVKNVETKVEAIEKRLSNIEYALNDIAHHLRR